MTLANYISDLLYRYECVIIPNFGGFITNNISAKVNHFTHVFHAPSKELSFNSHLKNNDGLLANYISTCQNISYEKALSFIDKEINDWNTTLAYDELELENIGALNLTKEGILIFEPSLTVNYLTSSFGLSSYVSPAVKRIAYKEQVEQLEKVAPVIPLEQETSRKTPTFIKYAATAAIVFALGTVGWNQYNKMEYNNLVAKAEQQQQKVEKTIQEATFIIENPLPAITLNIAKETQNYHVVAGAFREPANAEKKLQQLIEKGYSARILGVNKWNLTQVSYGSFNSKNEAINSLNKIKKTESKDAWLLVKAY